MPELKPASAAPDLGAREMQMLQDQIRALSRQLSRDQMLEIADLLHELIRERTFEARSWARLARRASTGDTSH